MTPTKTRPRSRDFWTVTSDCLQEEIGRTQTMREMMENASDRSRGVGVMAEKKRRGGRYCIAGGPVNTSCMNTSYSPAIKMHQFPKNPDVRHKWIKFVQKHRPSFKNPSKHASLCSAHFEESCYHRPLVLENSTGVSWRRNFIQGSIPTRDSLNLASPKKLSARKKRQVRPKLLS